MDRRSNTVNGELLSEEARSPEKVAEAEAALRGFELIWRARFEDSGPLIEAAEDEKVAERFEVGQFAFDIMASIMRTAKALTLLARESFAVESTPMFRSLLDQALALEILRFHGVHAVHAFGLAHKFNFENLLKASRDGFPLCESDYDYIAKFIEMANGVPKSEEMGKAQHAIKTSSIGTQQGLWEKCLYQMWLEATPLSKPSMKLADMYCSPEKTDAGLIIHTFLDSAPESTVDSRLVLQFVVPNALLAYSQAVRDRQLATEVRAAILLFHLPIALRIDEA